MSDSDCICFVAMSEILIKRFILTALVFLQYQIVNKKGAVNALPLL